MVRSPVPHSQLYINQSKSPLQAILCFSLSLVCNLSTISYLIPQFSAPLKIGINLRLNASASLYYYDACIKCSVFIQFMFNLLQNHIPT